MGNFLLQTKLFEICSKTYLNVSETFELFRKRLEINKNSIYWKLFIWDQTNGRSINGPGQAANFNCKLHPRPHDPFCDAIV